MKKTVVCALSLCFAVLLLLFNAAIPDKSWSLQSDVTQLINGMVTSQYGHVADARVRVAGSESYTLSDKSGRFTIETDIPLNKRIKITAGKDGWFNNAAIADPGGGPVLITLNPLPSQDNKNYRFISPANCARCHNKLARYWDKSKMAHTTSNVKVLNMYNGTDSTGRTKAGPGYKIDNPEKTGSCTVCHAPSVAVRGDGSEDLNQALWSAKTEWDGISCDYCHKVRKVIKSNSSPSQFKPVMKRQTPLAGNSIMVFGPYDDVVNTVMSASFSPVFDKGSFCSSCHSQVKGLEEGKAWDRKKVYSDSEWNSFEIGDDSVLPVQTTYQEWKSWQNSLAADDSNKGKKCQDCHMSWRKEMLPYDNYIIDGNARNMWGTFRSPKEIRPHHFDGGTEIQLKTALSMEIEGNVKNGILDLNVFITNTNGGHWVPTGETMRSIMLVLNATNSEGVPLEQVKGTELPDWTGVGSVEEGNYAGLPGRVFAKVLQDEAGNLNVPFWQAASVASDNRIRPKTTETLNFQFKLTDPDDEPTVEAKLTYRPVFKALAEIKKWKAEDILITESAW